VASDHLLEEVAENSRGEVTETVVKNKKMPKKPKTEYQEHLQTAKALSMSLLADTSPLEDKDFARDPELFWSREQQLVRRLAEIDKHAERLRGEKEAVLRKLTSHRAVGARVFQPVGWVGDKAPTSMDEVVEQLFPFSGGTVRQGLRNKAVSDNPQSLEETERLERQCETLGAVEQGAERGARKEAGDRAAVGEGANASQEGEVAVRQSSAPEGQREGKEGLGLGLGSELLGHSSRVRVRGKGRTRWSIAQEAGDLSQSNFLTEAFARPQDWEGEGDKEEKDQGREEKMGLEGRKTRKDRSTLENWAEGSQWRAPREEDVELDMEEKLEDDSMGEDQYPRACVERTPVDPPRGDAGPPMVVFEGPLDSREEQALHWPAEENGGVGKCALGAREPSFLKDKSTSKSSNGEAAQDEIDPARRERSSDRGPGEQEEGVRCLGLGSPQGLLRPSRLGLGLSRELSSQVPSQQHPGREAAYPRVLCPVAAQAAMAWTRSAPAGLVAVFPEWEENIFFIFQQGAAELREARRRVGNMFAEAKRMFPCGGGRGCGPAPALAPEPAPEPAPDSAEYLGCTVDETAGPERGWAPCSPALHRAEGECAGVDVSCAG
ncbi:unnamed protein product, partial [Discosporangium mesarthrocarpum]